VLTLVVVVTLLLELLLLLIVVVTLLLELLLFGVVVVSDEVVEWHDTNEA
jgi:hypothetical protein